MNIKGMEVYFASDLKDYGYTEDGTKFIGEVLFIEVQGPRGNRWRMRRTFDGVRVVQWEEGPVYMDNRPEATAICERIVASIKRIGSINMNDWYEAPAAYGSEAYSTGFWEAQEIAMERSEG